MHLICDNHRQLVLVSIALEQVCHSEQPCCALSIAACKDSSFLLPCETTARLCSLTCASKSQGSYLP